LAIGAKPIDQTLLFGVPPAPAFASFGAASLICDLSRRSAKGAEADRPELYLAKRLIDVSLSKSDPPSRFALWWASN